MREPSKPAAAVDRRRTAPPTLRDTERKDRTDDCTSHSLQGNDIAGGSLRLSVVHRQLSGDNGLR